MKDLCKAKELLRSGDYTCVICRGDDSFISVRRGVVPLVMWLGSGHSFKDHSAADKVVGRATAFLYVLLGVKALHARVVSRAALEVLDDYSVTVEYDELADKIINRTGDGICPFEAAVLDVTEPEKAYDIILAKMREMNITV